MGNKSSRFTGRIRLSAIIFAFVGGAALAVGGSGSGTAQAGSNHNGSYCDKAETTADLLQCVKHHKEEAQAGLNKLYKKMARTQPEEDGENSLGTTQQAWLSYRDAQCSWEAGLADEGQDKIYELSCVAAMTENRRETLQQIENRGHSLKPREYSSHPRWMNVLAHDFPDVYWRYSNWVGADLNCDGTDEEIITGVTLMPDASKKSDQGAPMPTMYQAEVAVAIADNVAIGRPVITMFKKPIMVADDVNAQKVQSSKALCGLPEGINFIDDGDVVPTLKAAAMKGEASSQKNVAEGKTCKRMISLADGDCAPLVIYWDGAAYKMQRKMPADIEDMGRVTPEKSPPVPPKTAGAGKKSGSGKQGD